MKTKTILTYKENMEFDVELNGHHFTIDADSRVGGKDRGPRPKALVLSALGGCTGMDVVSILHKMKVEDFKLTVDVEAGMTEEYPQIYKDVQVNYRFTGDVPPKKAARAVHLSETKYCGVTAMLEKSVEIKSNIFINGEKQ